MGFFQDAANQRKIRMLRRIYVQPTLKRIHDLQKLPDNELQNLALTLKEKTQTSAKVPQRQLTVEAFALACLSSHRTLKMMPFDTQILAAAALCENMIIEMKTGEGKTLSAALAAYRKSLTGNSVHVVTVNDYLAERDCEWMNNIYTFLGQTSAAITHNSTPEQRSQAYRCDITYGTNNEFGFDYLRDQMVFHLEDQVQRSLDYVILDEADSILIDEARTPLIISGPSELQTSSYEKIQQAILKVLKNSQAYTVEPKERQAHLTELGIQQIETLLQIDNLYSPRNIETLNQVEQAVTANLCFHRDEHYLVIDNEIKIIDEFTGRLANGRRWSNGLHQAIEAKEGVKISPENLTHATITFQSYFRMYKNLSGMTGTIMTEKTEIESIYRVPVINIPTQKPIQRKDETDIIYRTKAVKNQKIIEEIQKAHEHGQPILVGTATVTQAENISKLLSEAKIPHRVLSAKHHQQEAQAIAQAGRIGAVTIATHLAGRGTDIILGGNAADLVKQEPGYAEMSEEAKHAALKRLEKQCQEEARIVKELGGLFVLGTERHESRRIDNQLRGRAGRQGDVGRSLFILSAEDDLIQTFSGEKLSKLFQKLKIDDNLPLQNSMIVTAIQHAQSQIESANFSTRKMVFEFDQVFNHQRTAFYAQRQQILSSTENLQDILEIFDALCEDIANNSFDRHKNFDTTQFETLQYEILGRIFLQSQAVCTLYPEGYSRNKEALTAKNLKTLLKEKAQASMLANLRQLPENLREQLAKALFLQTLDHHWKKHLTAIDDLRAGIGLRGYAQKKPIEEFKREGFQQFLILIEQIRQEIVRKLLILSVRTESTAMPLSVIPKITAKAAQPTNSNSESTKQHFIELKTKTPAKQPATVA